MPRGPSYTAEEIELMTRLAKDKTLAHAEKVTRFFGEIKGPSDRTPDAIGQKIRKLESAKKAPAAPAKKAPVAAVAAAAPVVPQKKRGRPPKSATAAVTAPVAVNGNGHKNGNGNGHSKLKLGDITVQLGDGVALVGPASKVGSVLAQLG